MKSTLIHHVSHRQRIAKDLSGNGISKATVTEIRGVIEKDG